MHYTLYMQSMECIFRYYLDYALHTKDDSPLYIFDSSFGDVFYFFFKTLIYVIGFGKEYNLWAGA